MINEELVIYGTGNEKCYSLEDTYTNKEYRKNMLNGIMNIFLNQKTFPVILSLIDVGPCFNICEELRELSIKYSIESFAENHNKNTVINQQVIEIVIKDEKELFKVLSHSFKYAGYGQTIMIASNSIIHNTLFSLGEHLNIRRIVECSEEPNSTIVFNSIDQLIWGIVTNCQEYMDKKDFENIILGKSNI